jgi:uncharacterized protein (TIGR00645 family)
MAQPQQVHRLRPVPAMIFAARWLQLPLYLGLILAMGIYVYQFWKEMVHILHIVASRDVNETEIMLGVLSLIDVVMIANLLIMVIVGGYETFVSRLYIEGHPDQPEWLSHVNASVLKVKLATAIIGISSIHLLKTFINAAQLEEKTMMWQTIIHLTFLVSAIAIAAADRVLGIRYHEEHQAEAGAQ